MPHLSKTSVVYRRIQQCARRLPWPRKPAVRKPVVALTGGGILLLGVGMIVLPGPAIIVIPLGLAILAMEFNCVRRWFRSVRRLGRRAPAATSDSAPD